MPLRAQQLNGSSDWSWEWERAKGQQSILLVKPRLWDGSHVPVTPSIAKANPWEGRAGGESYGSLSAEVHVPTTAPGINPTSVLSRVWSSQWSWQFLYAMACSAGDVSIL